MAGIATQQYYSQPQHGNYNYGNMFQQGQYQQQQQQQQQWPNGSKSLEGFTTQGLMAAAVNTNNGNTNEAVTTDSGAASTGAKAKVSSSAHLSANSSNKRLKSLVERALLPTTLDADVKFSFEPFLRKEYQFGIDPSRPICKNYVQGKCELGNACPDRHVMPSLPNQVVCKHWLRGLCKKGEACEFLHEYNLRKMPECTFFAR